MAGENIQNGQAVAPEPTPGQEGAAAAAAAQAAARPDGLPDEFWKNDTVDFPGLIGEMKTLREFKGGVESLAAQVPDSVEGYEIALPDDVELPEGVEVKFDPEDPLWVAARNAAKANNLSKEGFKDMLGILAVREAQAVASAKSYHAEQMKALGEKADARIGAIKTFLSGALPEAQAKAIGETLDSADAVKGFETIMQRLTGTSVASAGAQNGRKPAYDESKSPEQNLAAQLAG